jgi:DNA/RNA-binding domain of Phe-tRNA-synthetase-like protein
VSGAGPPDPSAGWLSPAVAEELPGLGLLFAELEVGRRGPLTGDSPPDVEERMREMSNRIRGARAIGMRREPVPAAYRVFFRQVGMDPDVQRTPIESAVLERMLRGGFLTGGLLDDILLLALLDTAVPVWALDAAHLDGPLGIRASEDSERLGRRGDPPMLAQGRLVVADSAGALAVLFGDRAPGHVPSARTSRLTLFAVQVPGVPALYVEEALWACATALQAP